MTQKEEKFNLKEILVRLILIRKLTMRQSETNRFEHLWVGVQEEYNKSRSTKVPAPKVATQQKRDSLVSTSERKEGEEFPNKSTASTSQNVAERRYQTKSASGIT